MKSSPKRSGGGKPDTKLRHDLRGLIRLAACARGPERGAGGKRGTAAPPSESERGGPREQERLWPERGAGGKRGAAERERAGVGPREQERLWPERGAGGKRGTAAPPSESERGWGPASIKKGSADDAHGMAGDLTVAADRRGAAWTGCRSVRPQASRRPASRARPQPTYVRCDSRRRRSRPARRHRRLDRSATPSRADHRESNTRCQAARVPDARAADVANPRQISGVAARID